MESGEETTDWETAKDWDDAYVRAGQESILVLTRPTKRSLAYENLFALDFAYSKVRHEKRYLIHTVSATQIPIDKFRGYFGGNTSVIARDLIWELESLHSRTLGELKSQTERMREELKIWNRLSSSIV